MPYHSMTQRKKIKSDAKAYFYFVRKCSRENSNCIQDFNSIEIGRDLSSMKVKKIKLEKLLKEYKDIFQKELLDRLSSKCGIDHAIETGNACPVNKNAYPLSVEQLKK